MQNCWLRLYIFRKHLHIVSGLFLNLYFSFRRLHVWSGCPQRWSNRGPRHLLHPAPTACCWLHSEKRYVSIKGTFWWNNSNWMHRFITFITTLYLNPQSGKTSVCSNHVSEFIKQLPGSALVHTIVLWNERLLDTCQGQSPVQIKHFR